MNIGDRIKATVDYDCKEITGKFGTIIGFSDCDEALVEFDEDINGHDGSCHEVSGINGKDGYCWYVGNKLLEPITEA